MARPARVGRWVRVLGVLPPFYVLLHAALFEWSYHVGLESWLESPDAYFTGVILAAAVALALAGGAALVSEQLPEGALLPLLLVLNAAALMLGVIVLGAPSSTPLLLAPVVALVLLLGAYTIGRPRLPSAVMVSAAIAGVAWLGQAPCAEVPCLSSAFEAAQLEYPVLVVPDRNQFNIIKFRDRYYAIDKTQGRFEIDRYLAGEYSGGVDGSSLAEVLRKLDNPQRQGVDTGTDAAELIVGGYRSPLLGQTPYDVYRQEDRFYAIPEGDDNFDLDRYLAGGYNDAFDAASLDELLQMVDVAALVSPTPVEPVEHYRGYAIYGLDGILYAIQEEPADNEPFSLDRYLDGEYRGAVDGDSLEAVREGIDARLAPGALIHAGYRGYDLWEWGGRYFGIPERYAAFDIDRYELGEYEGAVEGPSIPEAIQAIDEATGRTPAGGTAN